VYKLLSFPDGHVSELVVDSKLLFQSTDGCVVDEGRRFSLVFSDDSSDDEQVDTSLAVIFNFVGSSEPNGFDDALRYSCDSVHVHSMCLLLTRDVIAPDGKQLGGRILAKNLKVQESKIWEILGVSLALDHEGSQFAKLSVGDSQGEGFICHEAVVVNNMRSEVAVVLEGVRCAESHLSTDTVGVLWLIKVGSLAIKFLELFFGVSDVSCPAITFSRELAT